MDNGELIGKIGEIAELQNCGLVDGGVQVYTTPTELIFYGYFH